MDDDTQLFARIARKKQKNLTMSREVCGALDELTDNGEQSEFVERAIWTALIDEYGREAVLDAIEATQAGLDEGLKIEEPETVTIPA